MEHEWIGLIQDLIGSTVLSIAFSIIPQVKIIAKMFGRDDILPYQICANAKMRLPKSCEPASAPILCVVVTNCGALPVRNNPNLSLFTINHHYPSIDYHQKLITMIDQQL